MAPTSKSNVQVPAELTAKFPVLIELILSSESMNDEERQYWVNILPVMTDEQIKNLYGILENEKNQLAAIDRKYSNEIEQIGQNELVRRTEEVRKKKMDERRQKEKADEEQDEKNTNTLLDEIDKL